MSDREAVAVMSGTGSELTVVEDAVCLACGCLCDDITLTAAPGEGRILEAKRACERGAAWFLSHCEEGGPEAWIDGEPARVEEAVVRAVEVLLEADNPLIYGLSATSSAGQRAGVALADWIGGVIDSAGSAGRAALQLAVQSVGEVTCTLGEVRHRADLLIYWGSDPAETHPRHFERYSLASRGMFVPRGREDRFVVVVDPRRSRTAEEADLFVQVQRGSDFELAWALRALVKGIEPDTTVEPKTGVSVEVVRELAERMQSCRYGAIVFGEGLTQRPGGEQNCEAVLTLARDLNRRTRFVVSPLGGAGNPAGADQVLAWSMGFPWGIGLGRGYPQYGPGEFTANEVLERGEADAAVIVAADPEVDLSQAARAHLEQIPVIALGPAGTERVTGAAVGFVTSTCGISEGGTVYRMDNVALPLRPALVSQRRSDVEILNALVRELRSRQVAALRSGTTGA